MLDLVAFKNNYLTVGLTDEQVAEIAALAEFKRFTAQTELMKAGSPANEIYLILDGRCVVLTPDNDKLSEVGPGSVLGEIGLVDARPRTANVMCMGLVDAAVIPAAALRQKMAQNREWGFIVLSNLSRVLAGRLRQANEKIDELYDKTTDAWDGAL